MEGSQIEVNNEKNEIIDYLIILLKYKKLILSVTLISVLISIILYFFVFDLIFFSTATIKSSSKGSLGLMGLDNLPDLGGLEDLAGGGKSTKELSLYQEILTSRRCIEPLIIKFGLMDRDEFKYIEDAIKDFRKNRIIVDIDKQSGLLKLGVYDKNKEFAKEMVEFLLEELNKINIELSITNAKNNREFIENRYIQSKNDLAKAEDTLKAFQQIYGIAPDLQIKASAQSVFTLEAELKAEEVKLDVIKQMLSSDQPEVKLQEAKVNSLRSKINGIETSTDLNDFLRLGNSPIIAMSYLRLQREIEIQTKILSFIMPLYEQAKIEEKRETPSILVLEKPYVAERKEKPKRLTMVIVTLFGSLFFMSVLVILYEMKIKNAIFLLKNKNAI